MSSTCRSRLLNKNKKEVDSASSASRSCMFNNKKKQTTCRLFL